MIVVIKIGTSTICNETTFVPKLANLSLLVETIARLRAFSHQVVLVTSGAVGVGLRTLRMDTKPNDISTIQAIAAVGQGRLMALYDSLFNMFDIPIAQILLTRDNLCETAQYENAQKTITELFNMGVLPIINENDSVSSCEIRYGDNDTLSAMVAGVCKADCLFLLTDVDGLYSDNPRTNPDAKRFGVIKSVQEIRNSDCIKDSAANHLVKLGGSGSTIGTGGMVTKLIAAELTTSVGCRMIISLGTDPLRIIKILEHLAGNETKEDYEPEFGTHFLPMKKPMKDRKWWIKNGLSSSGEIWIDQGAKDAITSKLKYSLFAAGIVDVTGYFNAQQGVSIKYKEKATVEGQEVERVIEVARGITDYSSEEIKMIKGHKSHEISQILKYKASECVVSRHNLAVLS